jgi:hypothetical protein
MSATVTASFSSIANAAQRLSNASTTVWNNVVHNNPTKSIFQGSTDRYTPSAQAYTIQQFTSGGAALGSSNMKWEFERTADLGGQPFLILGLVGLANCVYLVDDASDNAAVCEIVHPDILDHYRMGLNHPNDGGTAAPGRVISETDSTFEFYATDGADRTATAANFIHHYEGQPYWTPNVGYHAQNSVTELIGSSTVDVQHGLRQAAWAEVNSQPGKRLGAMVGGSDLGSIRHNKHLELKRRSMRYQVLCVPLLSSLSNSAESYRPLPAMQFHKVELCYNLRPASQLICNASRLQSTAGSLNAGGKSSIVAYAGSAVAFGAPFVAGAGFDAGANVYTICRYGEDSATNAKSNKGNMIALVDDASWALTNEADLSGTTWAVTNAKCEAMIGARMAFLQGAERASMIQGGYDIPILNSQYASGSATAQVANTSATVSVDVNTFVNSIEALYVVMGSSNALGANHFNAGRTWDPLVEEYTTLAATMTVTLNGNPAFDSCHPELYNKMLAYICGTCVPTGDSHVLFVPFSMKANSTESSVEAMGSAEPASRWSTGSVSVAMPHRTNQTAVSAFAGATNQKTQYALVYGDTYNSLHVGQGVGGLVMSGTNVPTSAAF